MPIIPVRDLAKGGVVKDVLPVALPMPSWTNARNVVFSDGKALRSPVWRTVWSGLNSSTSPVRFCIARTPSSGFDEVIVGRDDTSLVRYFDGVQVEASETGWVAAGVTEAPWSGGFLGDVLYVNRPDIIPRSLVPEDTVFEPLASWDPTWRCGVLRTFQNSVIALNVTKAGNSIPSDVKISDIAFYGAVPDSWDATDPTKLAFESPLAQLTGPILDGLTLGTNFLIYTAHQALVMTNNGTLSYGFQLLFGDDGVVNTNCVLEHDGLHYVFGSKDIYVTDGLTKRSLADGRVREWIYRTINIKLAHRCFVSFNAMTNEVIFAYVSGDASTAWKTPTGCNNAATYNLSTDTWSFIDLPNVSAMTHANVDSVLLWSTSAPRIWSTTGGSWYDQQDSVDLHTVAIAAPLNTLNSSTVIDGNGALLGYDFIDRGQLAFTAESMFAAPSFLERTGIALDDAASGGAPLRSDKLIRCIYPEVSVSRPVGLTVAFAGQMTTSGVVAWGPEVPYDPDTDYRIDTMTTGRFLAMRFTFQPFADTEVAGFDVDAVSNGNR